MKLQITFFLLLLWAAPMAFAQHSNSLVFHTETYNFGRIPKPKNPIKYEFVFQNTSNKPVMLHDVEVDCACATTQFPKTNIEPNEESVIEVSFSPYRAGAFDKEFHVTVLGSPETHSLRIKGFIMPYNEVHTENDFIHQNGSLRFRQKNLNLGTLTTHIAVTKKFYFHNSSTKNITFTKKIVAPAHIKVFFDSSMTVKANKIGAIVLTYNPQIKHSFGYLLDEILLETQAKEKIKLTVAADIQPDTYITDATGAMPSICVSEALHTVENVSPDADLVTEFVVRNVGTIDLKIHKISASEGCEVISDIEAIAPNESRIIKVKFMHNGKHGSHDRFFTIYSNDPFKSKQVVALRANIKD